MSNWEDTFKFREHELLEEICQLSTALQQGCCSCSLQVLCEEKGDASWEEWVRSE